MSAAWQRQRRGPSPGARRSLSQLWRVHLCVLWSRVGAPGAVTLPVVWTALVAAPRNVVSQVLLLLDCPAIQDHRPRKCAKCKRARCGGELCDVETLRTRAKTATPPASWSRDPIRRVAALEELRKDLTW